MPTLQLTVVNGERFYADEDGALYPSVTTVLGVIRQPFLETWRGRVGNEAADAKVLASTEAGSRIHDALYRVNTQDVVDTTGDTVLARVVESYSSWSSNHVESVISAEEQYFSPRFKFAGTPDLVSILKGRKRASLIDFKTGGTHEDMWELQLAAYREMLAERGIETEEALVLQFDKDTGGLVIHRFVDPRPGWKAFRAALDLYRYVHRV